MIIRVFLLLIACTIFFPSRAFGEEEIKRLAVLEFSAVGVDKNLMMLFSDQARSGIIKSVDKDEILVMTRESTMQILKDMGKDVSCIGEGSCEVEIARNIGADYVVTGTVVQMEPDYVITLKLHDTHSSALIASNTIDAGDIQTLRKATLTLSKQLMLEGFGESSSQEGTQKSGFSGELDDDWDVQDGSDGVVHFHSKPNGAIVMMDGELLCQETPCSRQIELGGHQILMQKEKYRKTEQVLNLEKGQEVRFQLEPDFGLLDISSKLIGPKLYLDGEYLGEMPMTNVEISKGSHVLTVQDECYIGKEYHFSIKSGETRKLEDYPVKMKSSGVKVSVIDQDGNAQEAKIYIDGEYLGISPLTEKIPLCSKQILAEFDGARGRQALHLTEKQVADIELVLGGKPLISTEGYDAILISAGESEQGKMVQDFYMMKSEVTQEFYEQLMGENPSSIQGKKHPVENVSWYDAVKFANKLSQEEGIESCYQLNPDEPDVLRQGSKSCKGWRLPSEAEWVYASGNGEKEQAQEPDILSLQKDLLQHWEKKSFEIFDDFDIENPEILLGTTYNVCEKQINELGLCDMSSNVWEWAIDWGDCSASNISDIYCDSEHFSLMCGSIWGYDFGVLADSSSCSFTLPDSEAQIGFRLVRIAD